MSRCDNTVLTYEMHTMIEGIVEAIRPWLKEGEKIIRRGPFRWRDDNGVLSNHYEMFSLEHIVAEFEYELVHNFCHVAVVRKK